MQKGHLILGRQVGESIVIGEGPDQIIVTVCRITNGQVRLGITARREIPVVRPEAGRKEARVER